MSIRFIPTNPDLNLPHHERISDPTFRHAVDLIDTGQTATLQALLQSHPGLVHQHVVFDGGNYFRSPTLLEFIAENPIRHGKLPANIVDVTRIILAAGHDQAARNEALMLVATGSVPNACKVQLPLINLLCEHGADPDSAIRGAAVHGEHEAVRALLNNGAKLDLPVAAALNLQPQFDALLATANPADRHLALAVSAQFGHLAIVQSLLDAGENPNRYNPPGAHSHSTPLHQAAVAGHGAVVHLLVARGGRLDLKDVLWHGTPGDWAAHGGKNGIERFLREKEAAS